MGTPSVKKNPMEWLLPSPVTKGADGGLAASKDPFDWLMPSPFKWFGDDKAKAAKVKQGVAPTDSTKAMLDAFQFAEINKKIRASSGRAQSFNTKISPDKTLLGQ